MAQTINLAVITVVVDDDTGMYKIGEVDGGFINNEILKHQLKKYGKEGIINQLTYMQWCVWNMFMEMNREDSIKHGGYATMQRQDL